MAVRKKGLGKGLDSMFPSYTSSTVSKQADENKDEAHADSAGTEKTVPKPKRTSTAAAKTKKAPVKKKETAQPSVEAEIDTIMPEIVENTSDAGIVTLKLADIEPNREQPRKEFRQEALEELSGSIRQYGIISPLVVIKRDGYYELVAGERRWRAAKMAGLKEVPVYIREYSDTEVMEVSLIENIQREDLNPIEEAEAYQKLLDECHLTQEELADKVSKNRATIANSLRLLKLDSRVREMLTEGRISAGHARSLLPVEDPEKQFETAELIEKQNLSVRETEKLVKKLLKENTEPEPIVPIKNTALDLVCRDMEDKMKAIFGTKVSVNRKNAQKGRIEIDYYSMDELERIYDLLRSIRND